MPSIEITSNHLKVACKTIFNDEILGDIFEVVLAYSSHDCFKKSRKLLTHVTVAVQQLGFHRATFFTLAKFLSMLPNQLMNVSMQLDTT